MRGGANGFVLSASENIETDDGSLGMTVLTSLGGRNLSDLAGLSVDHNEITLSDLSGLKSLSVGSTGINVREFLDIGHYSKRLGRQNQSLTKRGRS